MCRRPDYRPFRAAGARVAPAVDLLAGAAFFAVALVAGAALFAGAAFAGVTFAAGAAFFAGAAFLAGGAGGQTPLASLGAADIDITPSL